MKIELSKEEVRKIADICVVIGEVFLASLVIPVFLGSYEPKVLAMGLLTTCGAWIGSVYLVRKSNALL